MLEIKNLVLPFGSHKDPITLNLGPGKSLLIKGTNGAGKSTLLKVMMGFLNPIAGEVFADGRRVSFHSPKSTSQFFSYLPQKPDFHASLQVARIFEVAHLNLAYEWKAILELDSIWHENFKELSGGQQQRVSFALAIAKPAKLVLLDEPFASQDSGAVERTLELMRVEKSRGRSFVIASHIEFQADETLTL